MKMNLSAKTLEINLQSNPSSYRKLLVNRIKKIQIKHAQNPSSTN
jgi:hypothetical protein